jgi:hypothetical protein
MRALLIGSACYRDAWGDLDILCDQEWWEWWEKSYGCLREQTTLPNVHKYETCEGIYEVNVVTEGAHYELLMVSSGMEDYELPDGTMIKKCGLEFLAALKKAHLILPYNWSKHIKEYSNIKKLLSVQRYEPRNYANTIFKQHRAGCLAKAKKHPKLNVQKDTFFNSQEVYNIFDHDSIHEAIAYPYAPAYTLMREGEVKCSSRLWLRMSEDERLRCVAEEASILALERSIIPALWLDKSYAGARWAFNYALFKICTTITSGWFRDYAIEVYDEIVMPDYVNKFFEGLKRGVVKKYAQSAYE